MFIKRGDAQQITHIIDNTPEILNDEAKKLAKKAKEQIEKQTSKTEQKSLEN